MASDSAGEYLPAASWAIGVVVPQTASFSSGGSVSWGSISNVTVALQLPDIHQTDGTIYAILSVMTDGGSILQVAAGLMANTTTWGTISMWIRNPASYPQNYMTVQESPTPGIGPGSNVSLSIYASGGSWHFDERELGTNQTVHSVLNENISTTLKGGDQEVFALESYSSTGSVFANMGNLTLYSILLNGRQVTAGLYFYGGGWNPSHTPLFIVGGGTPPDFLAAQDCDDNVACWSYRVEWTGVGGAQFTQDVTYLVIAIVAAAIIVVGLAAIHEQRHRP